MRSQHWILESFKKDFLFFVFPTLFAVLLPYFFKPHGFALAVYMFLIAGVLGSGHTYTTFFLTYFSSKEWVKNKKWYLFVPPILFIFFILIIYLQFDYLWIFVVYAEIIHQWRQWYKIHLMNEKGHENDHDKNDGIQFSFWIKCCFYLLTILPIIIFHFRESAFRTFYANEQLPFFSWNVFSSLLVAVYLFSILFWIGLEIRKYRDTRNVEIGRVLILLTVFFQYGFCFMLATSFEFAVAPLLISHSLAYSGLMAKRISTNPIRKPVSYKKTIIFLFGITFLFGLYETYCENYVFDVSKNYLFETDYWGILGLAIYLMPQFSHYIFDELLWPTKKTVQA